MKKTVLLLVGIMLTCVSLFSGLPYAMTAVGKPRLYIELKKKATDNLDKLSFSGKREYGRLLRSYPDILMAYLIAYELDSNLEDTPVSVFVSNYEEIARLLAKDGLQYPVEHFLAYVAKQGVSDEPLTAYRKAMLDDGLQEIIDKYPDTLERYRQTALWCLERLRFQPTSGRDMSPLDITQKCLTGRCEEMQILFVAAARTVGIPSRAASTPWWAHMDNNHAWAEVYLDGAWHYTGDMDGSYHPDQTWFSGMIDKTVLILADGNLAPQGEEVLYEGEYDAIINSTPNYAKDRIRKLHLTVVDSLGVPLSKAQIGVMVYNWNSLRSLVVLETNEEGKLDLSVGRGAFYLAISKDGLSALELVSSGTETELNRLVTLDKAQLEPQTAMLEYPSNPMEWKPNSPEWNTAADAAKARLSANLTAFAERTVPEFASPADSLFLAVYHETRANYQQFIKFVKDYYPLETAFLELLAEGDPKLLWQADSEQFEALYLFYLDKKARLETLSKNDRQLLFDPTVYYEELPKPLYGWDKKPMLYPRSFDIKAKGDVDSVHEIINKLRKRYNIDPKKALTGLLPLHVAYDRKNLTNLQFRIITVSALRANGIPAELARIPDMISVLIDSDWQYYNVIKNQVGELSANSDTETGKLSLRLSDSAGQPLHISDDKISIAVLRGGMLYPMNVNLSYNGDGTYQIDLPKQELYLQVGYRVSDSKTGYLLRRIDATHSPEPLALTLDQYPRSWEPATEDILALLEGVDTTGKDVILIGNYDQENSLRLADKLREAKRNFLCLGYLSGSVNGTDYRVAPAWQTLQKTNPDTSMRTITLVRASDGTWQSYEGMWEKLPE